jgi:RNA polymerase sigma factor (TIGR02999 family)
MDPAKNIPQGQADEMFSAAYEELRRLATSVKRGDHSATLNPTALVNEAWLRLRASVPPLAADSPIYFKRIAARAMRQILIEAARRRQAQKRGGAALLAFDDARAIAAASAANAEEVLALDRALIELASLAPRQAQIVEARFFGGLQTPELVQSFGVSEATITREWRMARAWLACRIRGGDPP